MGVPSKGIADQWPPGNAGYHHDPSAKVRSTTPPVLEAPPTLEDPNVMGGRTNRHLWDAAFRKPCVHCKRLGGFRVNDTWFKFGCIDFSVPTFIALNPRNYPKPTQNMQLKAGSGLECIQYMHTWHQLACAARFAVLSYLCVAASHWTGSPPRRWLYTCGKRSSSNSSPKRLDGYSTPKTTWNSCTSVCF